MACVNEIIGIGSSEGGYLFATGEMNPRDTPVENMKAMVEAARRAGEPAKTTGAGQP